MANPRPCVGVPCVVNDSFTEETPTSLPARSTIGPPLLPGLMAASVWMRCLYVLPSTVISRSVALRMPRLTLEL